MVSRTYFRYLLTATLLTFGDAYATCNIVAVTSVIEETARQETRHFFGEKFSAGVGHVTSGIFEAAAKMKRQYSESIDPISTGLNGKPHGKPEKVRLLNDTLQQHPQIGEMAKTVNELLQDPHEISTYCEGLLLDVAAEVRLSGSPSEIQDLSIWNSREIPDPRQLQSDAVEGMKRSPLPRDAVMRILKKRAKSLGWKEIVFMNGGISDERFFQTGLGSGHLFRDEFGVYVGVHGIDSHLFQILLASNKLETKYGVGTARKFFDFVASKEGQVIWGFLFDRGMDHVRDLRGPRAFSDFGIMHGLNLE